MRYPNAPNREVLLESLDDKVKSLQQTVQRFVDGQAPRRCKECDTLLYVTQTGQLLCQDCGIGWGPVDNEWNWKKMNENVWYKELKHVWCDFNAIGDEGIRLTTYGSLESLEKNPVEVGERVLLTDDDIHMEGIITKGTEDYLFGVPDRDTLGDHCSECGALYATNDAGDIGTWCDDCAMKLRGDDE